MLDKLRRKAKKLYKDNNGTELCERYALIINILKDDECFMKMDVNEATSILIDLEVPADDILKTYIKLTMR